MAASTCILRSPSATTLSDGVRPHPRLKSLAPRCVGLPALFPPLPSIEVPRKAVGYCGKNARNVAAMASGDYVTTADSTEKTPVLSETSNTAPKESIINLESTTDVEMPEFVKSVQDAWDKVEDKYEISALGFAGFVALCGIAGMISAIDRLPLVPRVLELVGIGYTGWFVYRNLLSKSKREALIEKVKCTYGDILGSN